MKIVSLLLILTASFPASGALPQAVNLFMFNSKTEHTDLNPIETKNKKIQKCIDVGIWSGVTAVTIFSLIPATLDNLSTAGNGNDMAILTKTMAMAAAVIGSSWFTYHKIRN